MAFKLLQVNNSDFLSVEIKRQALSGIGLTTTLKKMVSCLVSKGTMYKMLSKEVTKCLLDLVVLSFSL